MDLITYCPAIDAMRIAIRANPTPTFYIDDEEGGTDDIKMKGGCHIPVKYHGNETICVVRGHAAADLQSHGLQILGYVACGEYEFVDDVAKATYERVRNQQTFTDEDGNQYLEHYKIGLIA